MTEETIFTKAIAISDPTARAVFLERVCQGDAERRCAVEALILAHHESNPLDRPAAVDANLLTRSFAPSSEKPGVVIAGRYKLLEEIGVGGMGTVWVAEQLEPVKRKVALKLIKPGMDSRAVLARFEAERQALALMDHPNIAKVHDGGLTDNGRPFFVMEYVKGIPITEYCDALRIRVEDRLQLFIQVCQAVQHAHLKGVIHRDLKPSNILVAPYDGKPIPKVIDFGLAKAMHQPLTEKTLHTAHETVLGTPLYMSPEQAQLNNLDVDTRSDIYSLGVLLYELLTGTTPLDRQRFKEAALDEIRRIIRDEEPPRPSARLSSSATLPSLAASRQTEPLQLTKLLRGELDWIVMKALEKERGRRYETANDFAADIQRYLSGDPAVAAPPSTGYRLRKFAHKHRRLLTTVAAFASVLIVATAISVWQAFRATKAEGVAEQARQEAVGDSKKAIEARDNESKARQDAVDARDALAKSSDRLRGALYASDMNLVSVAWNADQPHRMVDLLERHRPKKGELDLRGFEWHYWMRKLRSESRLVHLEGYGAASDGSDPKQQTGPPMFSPSGRRCVQAWESTDRKGFHLRVWDTSSGKLLIQSLVTSPGKPWSKLSVMDYRFSPDESRLHIPCFEAPKGLAIHLQIVLDASSGKWLYSLPADEFYFHPDNKRVLCTRSDDKGTRHIDWHAVDTGKKLKSFAPPGMEQAFFSKNLERCAAVYGADVGDQREVRVYETATGKVLAKLPLPDRNSGIPLQFSDDGRKLAMGPLMFEKVLPGQTKEKPAAMMVWDVEKAKHLWTRFCSPLGGGILFDTQGKHCIIAHAHAEEPIRVEVESGKEEFAFSGGNSYHLISNRATGGGAPLSRDGAMLMSWKPQGGVTVHSTATGKIVFDARFPADYMRACFTSEGSNLLAVDDTGKLRHWDTPDWLKQNAAPDPLNPENSAIVVEPDGRTIVALEEVFEKDLRKVAIREYDSRDGRLLRTVGVYPGVHLGPLPTDHRKAFLVDGFKFDHLQLVDFDSGREQLLWKRGTERFTEVPPRAYLLGSDRALVQVPADVYFASKHDGYGMYWGSRFRLVDLKTGAKVPFWLDSEEFIEFCAPSPDGALLAVFRHREGKEPTGARELYLAETSSGRRIWSIHDLGILAFQAVISPQSRWILVSGLVSGRTVAHVYDAKQGALVCRLDTAGTKAFGDFSFSPDGNRILGLDIHQGVHRLWDTETGHELVTFPSSDTSKPFRFDATGQRLLAIHSAWRTARPGHVLRVLDATPLPEIK